MSSFDVKACVSELQVLVDGKIEKIYHYPPDEVRFRIYKKEKFDLLIEAGKRIHLTKFPKEAPKIPSPFAMLLRKHLEGLRIKKIEQYDFDRIIILEFENSKKVVAELFSKGNIILLNENNQVIMPLKRTIKVGEIYKFPEQKRKAKDEEIVKFLANSGLGGLYAEEVLARIGMNKKKKLSEIGEDEKRILFEEVEKLKNFEAKPQIIVSGETYLDVVPIDLLRYKEFEKKYFKTFNEALDEFYLKTLSEKEEKDEEREKILKRLEIQKETLKNYEEQAEKYRKIADLIYENYSLIEKALKDGKKKVLLDGEEIEIFGNSLHEIAEYYYNASKKAKEKAEGVRSAIEKTLEELNKIKYNIKIVQFKVRRKREWFENYRWFISSDNFLAIGGRNAEMNEEIVSKYLEEKDLFFHTQTPGAPVVILKKGQEAPEKSLIEAAQFSATYSSLWKEGKAAGEVYYVKPDQVKKAAKAGEYLPKGGFYIIGKRNYLTVELSCAVGVEIDKMRVIGGPKSAVEKYADYFVELEVGEKDINELSLEISKKLAEIASDEAHIVKAIATPDEIAKFLPPGRSRIKE
ncbi:MAG: NFACT family protein [Archaeoglobaceae archaeon]|nr:NFACT family protein [Archaeoglobaceae archaeon]MCX8151503.1 NFACT family protein [Archaeoglobaceae archaeon]MDW8014021.1 NFACT family protein [Archaeoglobaceae archaeon]